MSVEKITATVTTWQTAMLECENRMEQLSDLTGPVVESPLGDAVYRIMGEYTAAVSELIEWDAETLSAWWLEHNFGEHPMMIGFPGEELRTIDSIEARAEFIAEDLERSK